MCRTDNWRGENRIFSFLSVSGEKRGIRRGSFSGKKKKRRMLGEIVRDSSILTVIPSSVRAASTTLIDYFNPK